MVFFRLPVAIPCLFSLSSDLTSPDMSALGIQHEYLKSNSKLQKLFFFFYPGKNGLRLNPHCDSVAMTVFQLRDGNKQEGGKSSYANVCTSSDN